MLSRWKKVPRVADRRLPLARASARRRIGLERLEPRNLFAALPLGATAQDTGEFMLGTVAVTPVFFDSTGALDPNQESWTTQEIEEALVKVRDGVQWWSEALDRLGTVHTLEFVIDDTFARSPFATKYEPILRTSQQSNLYISEFVAAQGVTDAVSLEDAVQQFNHAQRLKLGTDWSFTIFLIDSSNDDDGAFAPGSDFSTAFAFAGGLYLVSPSTRPTSTITHETGHIFWARDEYIGGARWTDKRGYYNTQNLNAADNPTPGFVQQPSIMRSGAALTQSYLTYELPESTRAMIGWQDIDDDGIFDVLDVPLELQGSGQYNQTAGVFQFSGTATAVALPNRNSSGTQNDITLNRIDRIEYRVDGGEWLTAIEIGQQVAEIDFELTVDPFTTIELRAIDGSIGVTSNVLSANGTLPILNGSALGGIAFVDASGEGEFDDTESILVAATVNLTKADGSPLFSGEVEPDQRTAGAFTGPVNGATLTALGVTLDGRVGAFTGPASTGTMGLRYFDPLTFSWQTRWSVENRLEVVFDEAVALVQLDAIGQSTLGSYGRLEAYDAAGNLIDRATTAMLASGAHETMKVTDSSGRIAKVVAFGHQATEVALDALRFGPDTEVQTDDRGVFQVVGLANGTYQIDVTPARVIHRQLDGTLQITVTAGVSTAAFVAFERITSPWQNPDNRFDVDGNGVVQPLDALRVINEIARRGSRPLPQSTQITQFFDTSDDGVVSALDALQIINDIARRSRQSEGEADTTGFDAVLAGWNPDLEKKSVREQIHEQKRN